MASIPLRAAWGSEAAAVWVVPTVAVDDPSILRRPGPAPQVARDPAAFPASQVIPTAAGVPEVNRDFIES
jgi:hypothetical protein